MIPGHEEGDRALIAIADLMKAAFRESDILARQGAMSLLFCSPIPAATMPRRQWRRSATTWRVSTSRRLTLAAGVLLGCVEYDPAHHPSLNALVATADRLMYQAKQKQGRERR